MNTNAQICNIGGLIALVSFTYTAYGSYRIRKSKIKKMTSFIWSVALAWWILLFDGIVLINLGLFRDAEILLVIGIVIFIAAMIYRKNWEPPHDFPGQ